MSTGEFTLWHPVGEGTVNGATLVLHEERYWVKWGGRKGRRRRPRGIRVRQAQWPVWDMMSSSSSSINSEYPVTWTETFFFFFHFCSSESMLGFNISREEEDRDCWKQHKKKNMEPADTKKNKQNWVRVGSFPRLRASPPHKKTALDSSHLESLKPVQERSWGRLQEGEEGKEGRENKRREKCEWQRGRRRRRRRIACSL